MDNIEEKLDYLRINSELVITDDMKKFVEGSIDSEYIDEISNLDIHTYLLSRKLKTDNIYICFDNCMGFYRWTCKVENI